MSPSASVGRAWHGVTRIFGVPSGSCFIAALMALLISVPTATPVDVVTPRASEGHSEGTVLRVTKMWPSYLSRVPARGVENISFRFWPKSSMSCSEHPAQVDIWADWDASRQPLTMETAVAIRKEAEATRCRGTGGQGGIRSGMA